MDSELLLKYGNDVTGERGMPAYYDREGVRISLLRQCELGSDPTYKILRTSVTQAGTVISAWIGEDRAEEPNAGAPYIFGTILQHNDGDFDHSVEGFTATPGDCLAYHELLVATLST